MAEPLPTYPLTTEGVTEALADLDKGGSEDVAIRLTELGITGVQDAECACPLAQYLLRAVPGLREAIVGGDSVYLTGVVHEDMNGFQQPWDVRFHVSLPDSLGAFVEDFDAGVYPELIEPTREVTAP